MVLTNAQKEKRYRKNFKARDLYHAMKSKHAQRMRIYRQSFTGQAKQDYDKGHAESQRPYRSKNIRLSGKFVQLVSKRISDIFGFCHSIEGAFLLRYTNFGPIASFSSYEKKNVLRTMCLHFSKMSNIEHRAIMKFFTRKRLNVIEISKELQNV